MSSIRVLVAGLSIVLSASSAAAQDRLVLGSREIGTAGRFGLPVGAIDSAVQFGVFGGGRFAVSGRATVRDLRTGAERTVTATGAIEAIDPNRPRVFVNEAFFGGLDAVDVATGQHAIVWSGPRLSLTARYAPAVDLVFLNVVLPGLPLSTAFIVVEASTGVVVRTLPDLLGVHSKFEVTDDGTLAFTTAFDGLTAIDTTSGATVGQAPLNAHSLAWDGAARRVLVFGTHVGTGRHLLLGMNEQLQVLGGTAVGATCGSVKLSPHTGRIYFAGAFLAGSTWVSTLSAFDGDGRVVATAPLGNGGVAAGCDDVTLLTAPGPPRHLTASISGHAVTLDWQNIGGASGFVLEVGVASGRRDVSVALGPDSRVVVPDVPSGTYFVRLRGGNEFGGGRPSQEICVVVP